MSYNDEITTAIKNEYDKSSNDRYDVIKEVNGNNEKKNTSTDILAILIIVLVVGGITFGIIVARKKSS